MEGINGILIWIGILQCNTKAYKF